MNMKLLGHGKNKKSIHIINKIMGKKHKKHKVYI